MDQTTKTRISSDKYGFGEKEIVIYRTETPDVVANFAMVLIEKWGLVAAMPDGEDSAGRAKCRLPTPQELVERAFAISAATHDHARATGHMVGLPDLNIINAESDRRREARLNRERADEDERAEKLAAAKAKVPA